MNDTNNKTPTKEHVAAALFDLTSRGALSWKKTSPEEAQNEEPVAEGLPASDASGLFAATHSGLALYLYEQDHEDSGQEEAVLQVVDPDTGAAVRFPGVEGLGDLYELVRFRTTKVERWMEEVVEEAGAELPEKASTDEGGSAQESAGGEDDEKTTSGEEAPEESGSGVFDAEEGSFDTNGDEAEEGIL